MLERLRRSFAAKLVALEIGTILLVSASLAALLITARVLGTRDLERSVSANAVQTLGRNLDDSGANASTLARRLAEYPPVATELQSTDRTRLAALLASQAAQLPPGETLVAVDPSGQAILARRSGDQDLGAVDDVSRWNALPAVDLTRRNQPPAKGHIENADRGIELDGVAAARVNGNIVGFIVDSIDLQVLLRRIQPAGSGLQYSVFYNDRRIASTLDQSALNQAAPAVAAGGDCSSFATYDVNGKTFAGCYAEAAQGPGVRLAADVDDGIFAQQRLNDALVVIFATGVLATIFIVVALLFARRYALRPLASLDRGAQRLAAGDYDSPVNVRSGDDFGRLAETFNRMSAQIQANTLDLERERAKLDAAITSLGAVSRALTTTTGGKRALASAVLEAMAEITGAEALAMYTGVNSPRPSATRGLSAAQARQLYAAADAAGTVAGGRPVDAVLAAPASHAGWHALVVPMVYQEQPVGALAAFSQSPMDQADVASLTVLASQAIVALENSELFERERETVVRLQELDHMKSDFLATIQHELRTPLTAIMGMTDLLEMAWATWGDEQKIDAIGDVQLAAKGLYDLVETILDYSMIESNRVNLDVGDYQARDLAEGAISELAPLIRRQQAQVSIAMPRGLRVRGDSQRLTQVLRALVDNAVKFSPKGAKVKISGAARGGRVQLQVSDRGIGIEPGLHQQVFERFYQVDNTATRRYGGTGMGLALAQRLVEMHRGHIEVESRPGKGSTFTVVLPAGAPPAGNGATRAARNGASTRG
ncbi:MAG: hypothetical protein QOE92_2444 [Chloroflexota bacterium]|nr:hypothetical protein [Chloroflexota bacterium]